MAIDKILGNSDLDSVADSVFSAVNDSVSEIKAMQKRKAAENVQVVVQALKKIESDLRGEYSDIADKLAERIASIKDGKDGQNGADGREGKDGRAGRDGAKGEKGVNGLNGRNGVDGTDGVSVTTAFIDFDGSLIINLSDGQVLNVGEVVAPDLAEKIKVISTMSTNAAVGIRDEGSTISTGVKNINFVGATVTATASGDDVTVNVSAGTGTVTSVAVSGGTTGLTTSGGPITTTGTISLAGTLAVANGGTGVTASTGTGSVVLSTSPTLVTPNLGTPASGTVTNLTGTASININGTVGATTASTGAFTTLTTSGTVTHNGGTANGVAFLNASKVLTTGSALTFDGSKFNNSSATSAGIIQSTDTAGSGNFVRILADSAFGSLINFTTGSSLRFATSADNFGAFSEQMRLTSTGLGIGTSAPSQILEIAKSVSATASPNFAVGLSLRNISDGGNRILFGNSISTTLAAIDGTIVSSGAGTDDGVLAFSTSTNGAMSERMRIDSAGNLGIGTISPGAKLDVLGNMRVSAPTNVNGAFQQISFPAGIYEKAGIRGISTGTTDAGALAFLTASAGDVITERMRVDSAGNLGIGTSSPDNKLTLNSGSINIFSNQNIADDFRFIGTQFGFGNANNAAQVRFAIDGADTYTRIAFTTSNGPGSLSEKMRITSAGNLLVGTTSNKTGAKINVAGGLGASANNFATVEHGAGASGTFTTITVSFTVDNNASSVILEVLMTGFSSVYLDHVAGRYSNQAAVVMRNNASAGTTVAALAVNGTGLIYTLTITTSVTHPAVKVKATVGGLGTITTLPTITFA